MARDQDYSVAETAEMLGVTIQRIYQLITEGKLAAKMISRPVRRILKSEIDRVLAERAARKAVA